jgi:hypothetical protein
MLRVAVLLAILFLCQRDRYIGHDTLVVLMLEPFVRLADQFIFRFHNAFSLKYKKEVQAGFSLGLKDPLCRWTNPSVCFSPRFSTTAPYSFFNFERSRLLRQAA